MNTIISPLAGAVILGLLVLSGAMAAADLAHPFWQGRATLAGGGAGMVIAALAAWPAGRRGRLLRGLRVTALIALVVALLVTWRAARVFIDSADYQPLAGTVWFFGYHALAALIVIAVALAVAGVRNTARG